MSLGASNAPPPDDIYGTYQALRNGCELPDISLCNQFLDLGGCTQPTPSFEKSLLPLNDVDVAALNGFVEAFNERRLNDPFIPLLGSSERAQRILASEAGHSLTSAGCSASAPELTQQATIDTRSEVSFASSCDQDEAMDIEFHDNPVVQIPLDSRLLPKVDQTQNPTRPPTIQIHPPTLQRVQRQLAQKPSQGIIYGNDASLISPGATPASPRHRKLPKPDETNAVRSIGGCYRCKIQKIAVGDSISNTDSKPRY